MSFSKSFVGWAKCFFCPPVGAGGQQKDVTLYIKARLGSRSVAPQRNDKKLATVTK